MGLYNEASLIMYPSGYKSGKIYCQKPVQELGAELTVNGDFATDSDWMKGSGWTISGGKAIFNGPSGEYIYQANKLTIGLRYRVEFDVYNANGSNFIQQYIEGTGTPIVVDGHYIYELTATQTQIRFRGVGNTSNVSIDNVTVKEILTESGDLTFTRASTATRVNSSGLIESVASNVPRIDFTGGGCGKLLLEPQRTNKALWNRDMTNAVWLTLAAGTGTDPVVTSNYAVSPSGDTDADRVVFNAGAGTTVADASILRQYTTFTSGLNYGYSVWLKSNTGSTQKIKLRINSDLPFPEVIVTNEWVRYSGLSTGSVTGSRDFGLDLRGNFAASADLLVWGFQLEENVSYITSLIPTAGSTVTRVADASTTTGLSSVIGQTEGTLYAEFTYLGVANTGVFERIIAISDGTLNNRVACIIEQTSKYLQVIIQSSGGTLNTTISTSSSIGHHKVALTYSNGSTKCYLDGVKIIDETWSFSINAALNNYYLGCREDGSGINILGGYIHNSIILDSVWSEVTAIALTTL